MCLSQGTVSFANIGGSGHSPVVGPDGPLEAGFDAQLQLANGTNVGAPAPILTKGLFSGGARSVDGFAGGSSVELRIAIVEKAGNRQSDCEFFMVSNVFTVELGGAGIPPSPPSRLPAFSFSEFRRDVFEGPPIPDLVLAELARKNQIQCGHIDPSLISESRSGLLTFQPLLDDLPTTPIESLEGIEQFIDLKDLALNREADEEPILSPSIDLSPISTLPELTILNLSGNALELDQSKLDILLRTPNLEVLILDRSQFRGALDLRGIPEGLRQLSLKDSGIEQVIFPENVDSKIESIMLDDNRITSLEISADLPHLERVSVRGNGLREFSAIDYSAIDHEAGIIVPSSLTFSDGKPRFIGHSRVKVSIQRSSDLREWEEIGQQEFRQLNRFIGSIEFTDESYSGGSAFYRLSPID